MGGVANKFYFWGDPKDKLGSTIEVFLLLGGRKGVPPYIIFEEGPSNIFKRGGTS